MSDKPRCFQCNSPDTVPYWDIKGNREQDQPNETMKTVVFISRQHYPNARKCVDCGEVWW